MGWVASDRVVSDGTTEIPDMSIAVLSARQRCARQDPLQAALKEVCATPIREGVTQTTAAAPCTA